MRSDGQSTTCSPIRSGQRVHNVRRKERGMIRSEGRGTRCSPIRSGRRKHSMQPIRSGGRKEEKEASRGAGPARAPPVAWPERLRLTIATVP